MAPRLLFGVILFALSGALLLPVVRRFLEREHSERWLLMAFVLSRAAGWLAIWVVFGNLASGSDLSKYYFAEARQAWEGQVPYRDFPSSYGPLFPYFAGLLLPVWPAVGAVAVMMVATEIAAVFAFHYAIARRDGRNRAAATAALAAYTVNPAALYWSGMLGYNSSVVLLFWVVAIACLANRQVMTSLVVLGGSVVVGKLLGVLAGPLWMLRPNRSVRSLAIVGAFAGLLVVALLTAGIDVTQPLQREGDRSTSGNLWFVASGLGWFSSGSALWRVGPAAAFATGCAAYLLWLGRRWARLPAATAAQICAAIGTVGWLFMLLSKKTYPHYTPMFLLPTIFALSSNSGRRSLTWVLPLALIGAIGIVEPGIWNALGQPRFLQVPAAAGDVSTATLLAALDVVLVALTGHFVIALAAISGGPTEVPATVESPNVVEIR